VTSRVVFVTYVDPTGDSGQNHYSRNVIRALGRREDVELTVICPRPASGQLSLPTEEVVADIEYLPTKRARSLRWHSAVQAPTWRALRRVGPPDAIVATLRPSLLVPPLYARYHGVPYRLLVEGAIDGEVADMVGAPGVRVAASLLCRLNLRKADRTLVVNDEVRRWAVRRGAADASVARHGVAEALRRADDPPTDAVPDTEHVVGYVGSFKPYHRLEILVGAVEQLRAAGTDVGLLLVGTGPEQTAIERQVQAAGLAPVTSCPGFVPHEEVGGYVQAADVCWGVIDPDRTGSPMKVYEYLACGRPVVATCSEELRFVTDAGAGRLLETVTENAATDALAGLLAAGPEALEEMGAAGREALRSREASWEHLAERLVDGIG
jgi:glycosyltransferase involved in cell wall biosynthesis